MEPTITSIGNNDYEVSEIKTRVVNKDGLKSEIKDLEKLIEEKRQQVGIPALEDELKRKKDLMAEIKKA